MTFGMGPAGLLASGVAGRAIVDNVGDVHKRWKRFGEGLAGNFNIAGVKGINKPAPETSTTTSRLVKPGKNASAQERVDYENKKF
jgi:hypothetical protein